MDEIERIKRMDEIEEQISSLPAGYISKKTINGKLRYYLQWTQDGKKRSKYIRPCELEATEELIEKRRFLQEELKSLKRDAGELFKKINESVSFETMLQYGSSLKSLSAGVSNWKRRDCYSVLRRFLRQKPDSCICLIYGLRRTGKTTMLRQAISDMTDEELASAAYIKIRRSDSMAMLNRDMQKLYDRGIRIVFIDEVTFMEDFISSAAMFSDIYAAMGMTIVLSGTDSLGFWFALDDELYDRAWAVHTTFIPYREYSRLLGIDSLDEYIRYGGTLRPGDNSFDEKETTVSDITFFDDESTRRYIDTSICRNIQNSLRFYNGGDHFRQLYSLYETGELTGAINRIIEDMNHRFVLEVLTRDFRSADLGISASNLRKRTIQGRRITVLDDIDVQAVTKRLMDILDIRNRDEQKTGIKEVHVQQIKAYLRALDLIADCPLEDIHQEGESEEHILFSQPGMRYCQAQALIFSLKKDEIFSELSEEEKDIVCEAILEEVRGRLMEDIILLESRKELDRDRYLVSKLRFDRGEFDMIVYDRDEACCEIFEIKHSAKTADEQTVHLLDEEKCRLTESRFGPIVSKSVIYLGPALLTNDGINYLNAQSFLKELPFFRMETPENSQSFSGPIM